MTTACERSAQGFSKEGLELLNLRRLGIPPEALNRMVDEAGDLPEGFLLVHALLLGQALIWAAAGGLYYEINEELLESIKDNAERMVGE